MSIFTRLLPFNFKRQVSAPLDVDTVFTTTEERTNYLSSPRRYAGMVVSDLQLEEVFFLNAAKTQWVNLSKLPIINIDFIYSSTRVYKRGTLVFAYDSVEDTFLPFICLVDGTTGKAPGSVQTPQVWSPITVKITAKSLSNLPLYNTLQELENVELGTPYKTSTGFFKVKTSDDDDLLSEL